MGIFKNIGTSLLIDDAKMITYHKKKILLRKLGLYLSDKFNKKFTSQDTLQYIYQMYIQYILLYLQIQSVFLIYLYHS